MIKLFIQNTASFDFAFLTKNSGPIGRSFYLDVIFEGKINANGMLIDFSHAKRIVKSIVQDFDHILMVSKKQVKFENFSHIIVEESSKHFFAMHCNRNWVKIISERILKSLENAETKEFENFISKEISRRIPKNTINISVKLKENNNCDFQHKENEITRKKNYFSYTHTLCHHAGHCQRFHGHSAEVSVFQNNVFNEQLSAQIAKQFYGLYIVSQKHLKPLFNSRNLEKIKEHCFHKKSFEKMKQNLNAFEYKGSKGKVSIIISKDLSLMLSNESTIENIAQYIRKQIPISHSIKVSVNEGLLKGALIE